MYARTLALAPADAGANAAFGKLALFADRLGEAESLLSAAVAAGGDPEPLADLYATLLRRGAYARAAELAPKLNDPGRVPMLDYLAEHPPYRVTAGPDEAKVRWSKGYPVPLVRVTVIVACVTSSKTE